MTTHFTDFDDCSDGPNIYSDLSDRMSCHHELMMHAKHMDENNRFFWDQMQAKDFGKTRKDWGDILFDNVVNYPQNIEYCSRDIVLKHSGNATGIRDESVPINSKFMTQRNYLFDHGCTRDEDTDKWHRAFLNNTKNRTQDVKICYDMPIDQEKEYWNAGSNSRNESPPKLDINYWSQLAQQRQAECVDCPLALQTWPSKKESIK